MAPRRKASRGQGALGGVGRAIASGEAVRFAFPKGLTVRASVPSDAQVSRKLATMTARNARTRTENLALMRTIAALLTRLPSGSGSGALPVPGTGSSTIDTGTASDELQKVRSQLVALQPLAASVTELRSRIRAVASELTALESAQKQHAAEVRQKAEELRRALDNRVGQIRLALRRTRTPAGRALVVGAVSSLRKQRDNIVASLNAASARYTSDIAQRRTDLQTNATGMTSQLQSAQQAMQQMSQLQRREAELSSAVEVSPRISPSRPRPRPRRSAASRSPGTRKGVKPLRRRVPSSAPRLARRRGRRGVPRRGGSGRRLK